MARKSIEMDGYYKDKKIIEMNNGHIIDLSLFSKTHIPSIPYGTKVEVIIKYEEIDLLNGTNGIVWSTYSSSQADTIKNALFVQNIFAEITKTILVNEMLYCVFIASKEDIGKAIDFIWKEENGMRLKPDWHYRRNEKNESFNKWTNVY